MTPLPTPLIIEPGPHPQVFRDRLIDGRGSLKEQIACHASNVTFEGCRLVNCPRGIVLWGTASNITLRNCTSDGSQLLNTRDHWTGTNVLVDGCRVNIPAGVTGVSFDQPANTVAWTGVRIVNSLLHCQRGAKRGLAFARCVGAIVSGCQFIGAADVEDLLHFEDKTEALSILGNQLFLSGARAGIDGSLGKPDAGFTHDDHDSRDILIEANLLRCFGQRGIFIQGKLPHVCERLSVVGNQISDASVAVEAKVGACRIENAYWNCGVDEKLYARTGSLLALGESASAAK